jgi:hypothetical protein
MELSLYRNLDSHHEGQPNIIVGMELQVLEQLPQWIWPSWINRGAVYGLASLEVAEYDLEFAKWRGKYV